jgi:H+/Cl- antiporter ClcA
MDSLQSLVEEPILVRHPTPWMKLAAVTILTGIGAGLGGMALALLLHFVQHLAYGYSIGEVISPESFLQGVSASSPIRRIAVLAVCGLVAGVGWWAVYGFGRPLVSISKAVRAADPRMPVIETLAHASLQIITVALGSPLGREVAPREIGATFAGWLSHRAGLSADESQIMVACGAGAGLAAVYNVPLAGAVFILEVLLGTFRLPVAIPAIVISTSAALIAWIGLGDESQYHVPHFAISPALVVWSIMTGPLFGYAAYWFARLTSAAHARAPRDWRLLVACPVVFLAIGLLAGPFPQLLGNGKGPTQLGFDSGLSIGLASALLVLKVIITTGTMRAGGEGGLLTPGLTIGALLGIVAGNVWNVVLPSAPLGAFAIIGGVAFLASSMRMPLTAIALILEFMHVDHDFWFPIMFAVSGSVAMSRACAQRDDGPIRPDNIPPVKSPADRNAR